jgi:hypothetical protein
LLFNHFRAIDVMTAQSAAPRRTIMTTFTIDRDNNITAFATAEEAAVAATTPFDTFASQKELAELAAVWPAERLVAIWNSLAGVVAVESFKNSKVAVGRIWTRIQSLGDAAKPKARKKAKGGPPAAKGAPAKGKASKKATSAKNATKAKKSAKGGEPAAPREGSKTEIILGLLRRAKGATLAEITESTMWQPHSVRGFLSGTLGKKMGLTVQSEKRDDGTRVYTIAK